MGRPSEEDKGQVGANRPFKASSKHFEDHCFEPYSKSKLSESLGLGKVKSLLKADAIPTIFERPASLKRRLSPPVREVKKRRMAYEKRERSRASKGYA